MIVAVQIGPNGRIGVEIFAAFDVPEDGAFAGDDHNRLALEPVAHLREGMPDKLVVEFSERMHLNLRFARLRSEASARQAIYDLRSLTRRPAFLDHLTHGPR